MKHSEAISKHRHSHPHSPDSSSPKAGAGQMALGTYSAEFVSHTQLGNHPRSSIKAHKHTAHSKGGR